MGSHVSVYAGKYDQDLKWPFAGSVELTLLNQISDRKHYTVKIPLDNLEVGFNWGNPEFIPHHMLERSPYENIQYLHTLL